MNNQPLPTADSAVEYTEYLSAPEVAASLGVAKNAVYRWMRERRLAHHRFGRRVRIHRGDLDAFVSASRQQAVPPTRYDRYPSS